MLLVIAVMIAALYVAKWTSEALPAGRWYTIGLALAGIILMPLISNVFAMVSGAYWSNQAGILAGIFLFPAYVWFFRSRRPAPKGAPLEALKETPAWRDAEQTVARAFRERESRDA